VTVWLRRLSFGIALAFLAAHALRLPETLEDLDSINFAMGVEQFDVANHQPHPPGYPVYIALARVSTRAVAAVAPGWDRDKTAATGLALLSALTGALAVVVLIAFWGAVGLAPVPAFIAAVLATMAPLFWITASRPLSDTPGLVAALAVQTLLIQAIQALRAGDGPLPRVAIVGAAAAGLAIGVRSQTLWLTGPLVVWCFGWLVSHRRFRDAVAVVSVAAAGALVWAVPLVWLSGGLAGYLQALTSQGQEDFAGVEMLATSTTWQLFESALHRTFIDPWQSRTLAHVVLVLTLVGCGALAWRRRPMLAMLSVAFVPYVVLHLAFQETATMRYALPALVPVAGLAVVGLETIGLSAMVVGATAIAAVSLALGVPQLDRYVREGAPVSRAFREMQAAWARSAHPPVLTMHHQVWWGVRRIIDWYRPVWNLGAQPFPGDREWLTTVEHFREGNRRPVWFLADPSRPDLAMFDPRSVDHSIAYRFPRELQTLIGGDRLDSVIWHSIKAPGWMIGRGWSLTPELAGTTEADRRAARARDAEAFVRRRHGPQRVVIGGRYLGPDHGAAVDLTVSIDEQAVSQMRATPDPRWFVHWIELPNGTPPGDSAYARLVVSARDAEGEDAGALVGLEQFDAAPADESMMAFVSGWHEREANPSTGESWRWTTGRSAVEIRGRARDRELVISGESPLRYFDRPPNVTVRAGDQILGTFTPTADFVQTIALPSASVSSAGGRVTIETDRTFSPSQKGSADRRVLGLRLYSLAVR
jgi:hypothetical protein